jgi:hypothetical protein
MGIIHVSPQNFDIAQNHTGPRKFTSRSGGVMFGGFGGSQLLKDNYCSSNYILPAFNPKKSNYNMAEGIGIWEYIVYLFLLRLLCTYRSGNTVYIEATCFKTINPYIT